MKTGRNDPCPCGSGKKYKRCCLGFCHTRGDEVLEDEQYYEALEAQYDEVKEQGLFEALRVLELDRDHSDKNLVLAVDYFNENQGDINEDAPTDFLSRHEIEMINRDGRFRPRLYSMLLTGKFSDGLQQRSAFIKHSNKYSF